MSIKKLTVGAAVAALGLSLAACGSDPTSGDKASSDSITIGSAGFAENEIIAEIYAQALEAKGVKVTKKLNIGAREVYIPALKNGEIDLLPEYSGNLLSYLDPKTTATTEDAIEDALDDALPEGFEVLEAAEAEDKDSLNVTADFAAKNGLKTIADLKKIDGLKLAAQPEFKERAYGIPGLEKVYGITGIEFIPTTDFGGKDTVTKLTRGEVDVADIYSTTPSIIEKKLVTLEDPKSLIAAQHVIPLINEDKATDTVEDVLNAISEKLTTADLLDLNSKNQGPDKTAPAVLAKEWLTANGLI